MGKILREDHGRVVVLRLANGVTNAIDPQLVSELSAALSAAAGAGSGLVLAGGEKFFSMGFDLPGLLQMDREGFTGFFRAFNDTVLQLFSLPVPTGCAMAGHAVAGGHILSLACDFRVAAPHVKLGLNEIRLGAPVPYLADRMLRLLAGDRVASGLQYDGRFVTAADGRTEGLVDDLRPPDEVEAAALERISALAGRPAAAFAAIKAARVEKVRRDYERCGGPQNEVFLECWFSETAQGLLREAARKF